MDDRGQRDPVVTNQHTNLAAGLAIARVPSGSTSGRDLSRALSASFPVRHSLRPRRVLDQRDVPCCVSCALAAAAETDDPDGRPLSPLFHYFVTRTEIMRASAADAVDVTLEDAHAAIQRFGICLERLHRPRMDEAGIQEEPSAEARADGSRRALCPSPDLPLTSRIATSCCSRTPTRAGTTCRSP